MAPFTKEMKISEILKLNPKAAEILFAYGMHCVGCSIAAGETLEQAAAVHGIKVEEILAELNKEKTHG